MKRNVGSAQQRALVFNLAQKLKLIAVPIHVMQAGEPVGRAEPQPILEHLDVFAARLR